MKLITVNCPECRKPNLIDPGTTSELVCTHCREKTLVVATVGPGGLAGAVLGENYLVEDRIGQGGFGEVYRGRDQLLQRPVAVKVLAQPADLDAERSGKFLREAVTAAQITHPNVVQVYDVGTDPGRGVHYLVMEFVEGRDLKARVEAEGPLPEGEVAALGLQIARGLAAAHARDIVHRDIKPGNIMETLQGGVKITDFGLAKILQVDQVTKTQTAGSVAYMPPEQFEGRVVDARADLYALGATLYFLLSGKTPYPGDHDFNVMYNILSKDPTPLEEVAPGASPAMRELIGSLLQKDPDRRPGGAEEVTAKLEALLGDAPSPVRPCPSCGALNEAGKGFCSGCGKSLKPGARTPGRPPPETAGVATDDDRTVVSAPVQPKGPWSRLSWKTGATLLFAAVGIVAVVLVGSDLLPRGVEPEVAGVPEVGRPVAITPEGTRLLKKGDLAGYLARGDEPFQDLVKTLVTIQEGAFTFQERLQGIQEVTTKLHGADETARAALLEGAGSLIVPLGIQELDKIPEDVDLPSLIDHLQELEVSIGVLNGGPLRGRAAPLRYGWDAILRLAGDCRSIELKEPYDLYYGTLEDLRATVDRVDAALKNIGADAQRWKDRVKELILQESVFSALGASPQGLDTGEEVYGRLIPALEYLSEIDGRDLGEILTEVEEIARARGLEVPWSQGG